MKKKLIGIMLMSVATVVVFLGTAMQGASTANAVEASQDNCKVVKRGDTLLKLFGKGSEKFVTLNGSKLKNPDLIVPGQRLCAKASGTKTVFSGKKQTAKPVVKKPASCINPGVAPFNRFGSMSLRIQGIKLNPDFTQEEKIEAIAKVKGEKGDDRLVTADMVFNAMPSKGKSGKVTFLKDVKVCTPEQGGRPEVVKTWLLSTGKVVGDLLTCGNIGPVTIPKIVIPTKPVPPQPPVVLPPVVLPPVVTSPPEMKAPPPPPSVPVKSSGICAHQVDAYTGAGKVWNKDSHYGYIGFDWYVKQWSFIDECGETHRLGFGADYAAGSGQAGTDGTFRWDAITLRPVAYKYTGTDGKTLRLRILITRVRDGVKADMDRYQNERTIFEWGPEAIFTDQGRKDSGEKWFSEHRASVAVLFAFNKSGSHSWEGTPITDTAELLKVKGMVRAGARLYVYDLDGGQRVFVQAGLSAQWPNVARSLGVSVGLDGPDELWTVFIGPNFDLKEHTHSFGVEVSLQIGKAYLYFRGLAAQSGLLSAVECIESDGNAYFPSTGVLVSGTCPKDTATGATPISASQ